MYYTAQCIDNMSVRSLLIIFLLVFLATTDLWPQSENSVSYSIFFIGDCGEPYVEGETMGEVLRSQVARAGANATVVFLGDNVYPKGLPPEGHRLREEGEKVLENQTGWLKGLYAKGIFLPGNHDWQHWGRKGQNYLMNQQRWLDSLHNKDIQLLPKDACPGPVEIPIDDHNVLVIIDTQWYLHQWDKPGEESSCDAKTEADLLAQMNDIFFRNRNKRVIVAAHHPLITYGSHGGVYPLKAHIFPLEDLSHYLYIPLPGLGSLYPLYRRWIGSIQDVAHPKYKSLVRGMQEIMNKYPGSLYAAGHEHSLQYIVKDSVHYIVSGSGAKTEYVKKKGHAQFAEAVRGFVRADMMRNGSLQLNFFQVEERAIYAKEIYSVTLKGKPRPATALPAINEYKGKFVRVHASDQYRAGSSKQKWLGKNYREAWAQDLDVPVFDIGSEKGGLKILQRGGGMQTLSLRLEDSTGREYVLRSVEKYPEHAVPKMLRKTFAQDLVQDQISASHPYAALVIPSLAEAAAIYHTNPRLVFIPDDERFGQYQPLFANTLALFEERPAGDWSDAPYFGNSKKIVNTAKVLEKLAEDNDNSVDQKFVLRSRLFDMVIGDWDRHDDQWRWATLKQKKGDVFRPIPRDRDQAFFVNEGKLSKLWSRRWALPKFEGFDEDIDWPSGLSFNARYFDRSFLNELTKDEWIAEAEDIRKSLTDNDIEKAIRQWPEEIFKLDGERVIKRLKARRDKLTGYAAEHYEFLAREVDVVGSEKSEIFVAERENNKDVLMEIYKRTKEGAQGKKLYSRTFHRHETKEIRLYGLGGDDEFRISGEASKTILIRIIGGQGNDVVADSSRVKGKKTMFYDRHEEGKITNKNEIIDKRSSDPHVNDYDRKTFQYNRLAPLIIGNFNPDDGLFIGGGFVSIRHGFRKDPFKERHLFLASIAPLTASFNFRYQAKFTEVIGKWNFELDANLKAPNYVNNFFGLGNETDFDRNIDEQPGIEASSAIQYYRFRFEELLLEPSFSRQMGNSIQFRIGPYYQRIDLERPEGDRFIKQYALNQGDDFFDRYNSFGGVSWQLLFDKRNDKNLTTRGGTFSLTGRNLAALNETSNTFSYYESSLALYQSFRLPARLTFALRVGGGINTGTYQFYQAQILDGKNELRGFRKTRFYGDSKFYTNTEVRVKLLSFRSYLFPATLGLLGFYDVGRVWYEDENGIDPSANGKASRWHKGVGGGIWFTPFNATVVSAETGVSNEGALVYLRLGFLF
jgi:hypothetical protein